MQPKKESVKTYRFSFCFLLLFATIGCEKTKLTDFHEPLIGSWKSVPTLQVGSCGYMMDSPTNPDIKLFIFKNGAYTSYKNKKKIEQGRLLLSNGVLKFIKNTIHYKGNEQVLLNKNSINSFHSNILNVGQNSCGDGSLFSFVRD